MLPASPTTLISCCVSRQVSVLCCISIQMKSTPSQAFLAASRSGPTRVLLKICLPSFSLVMTVLNVCEPALTAGAAGRAAWGGAASCGAGSARDRRCRAQRRREDDRRGSWNGSWSALSHTSRGAVTTVLCSRLDPMPEPHRVTRRQALTSLALAAGGASAAVTVARAVACGISLRRPWRSRLRSYGGRGRSVQHPAIRRASQGTGVRSGVGILRPGLRRRPHRALEPRGACNGCGSKAG